MNGNTATELGAIKENRWRLSKVMTDSLNNENYHDELDATIRFIVSTTGDGALFTSMSINFVGSE